MTGARNAGPMLALSFSGKNAVMIDQVADGYWVFCEGPGYDGEHEQYFAWREPRSTPDPWDASSVEAQTSLPQVGVYGFKPSIVQLLEQSGRFEVHELQGHVAVVLTAI
jgi:hypothetical protein